MMNWCAESKALMCSGDFHVVSLTTASWDLSQVTESVDVKPELPFEKVMNYCTDYVILA